MGVGAVYEKESWQQSTVATLWPRKSEIPQDIVKRPLEVKVAPG